VGAKCTDDILAGSDASLVRDQTRAEWLAAAERALQTNPVTFASLPIRELVRPDGLLEMLRAKGYGVRGQ